MKDINFSIVTYLAGEDFKLLREMQKEISAITGSQKCLIDWLPHITIGDGIVVQDDRLAEISQKFKEFAQNEKCVTAKIKDFGGTDSRKGAVEGKITPYVIWLDVEVKPELLKLFLKLRNDIILSEETWLPRTTNYVPHVTIVFADLSKDGYEKGLKYLQAKSLEMEFAITHVSLVECYGVGNMVSAEYKKFYFS